MSLGDHLGAGVVAVWWCCPVGPRDGWQPPSDEVACGFLADSRTLVTVPRPLGGRRTAGVPETGPIRLWDIESGILCASRYGANDTFVRVLVDATHGQLQSSACPDHWPVNTPSSRTSCRPYGTRAGLGAVRESHRREPGRRYRSRRNGSRTGSRFDIPKTNRPRLRHSCGSPAAQRARHRHQRPAVGEKPQATSSLGGCTRRVDRRGNTTRRPRRPPPKWSPRDIDPARGSE